MPIRRPLRQLTRRIILGCTPDRYRLVSEVLIERIAGRLEAEALMLEALTATRGTAIDVGASRGYYSYFLSRSFSRVVAFEPNERVIQGLVRYGAPNITIHHCGLSSSEGTLELHVPRNDLLDYSGWATFEKGHLGPLTEYDTLKTPVRRLDDFGLRGVSLMKIDVEGHELKVLQGGRRTIEESRPVVIIEIQKANRREADGFFGELRYTPHVVSGRRLQDLPEGLEGYMGPKYTFVLMPSP